MAIPPFTTSFPGQQDVYIPAFGGKANAKLIVSYARDPKKFAVNGLTQRTPVETMTGHWPILRPEALARVFQDPNAYIWVDGQPFPTGNWNAQDFRFNYYHCFRRAMPDSVGDQTAEQAVWPIKEAKLDALAHIMMTLRAKVFYTLMLNPANHLATHVQTATQWSTQYGSLGAGWLFGTPQNPVVQRCLRAMANQIRQDTMSTVSYKDLTVIIDPTAALLTASSQEIHWMLAQSRFAFAQIEGEDNQNGEWGLPPKLYGMNLIVDPTLQTLSGRLVIPGTTSDIMDYNTALVMAPPGALKANIGQVNSSFSTTHMFVYNGQEMVTKSKYMDWDQFTKLGIYETYDMRIVAPETTALATSLFV